MDDVWLSLLSDEETGKDADLAAWLSEHSKP